MTTLQKKIFDKSNTDRAREILAEQHFLADEASDAIKKFCAEMQDTILHAYERGEDISALVREYARDLAPLIQMGQVASHLRGKMRFIASLKQKAKRVIALGSTAYDDAVEFARKRLKMTDEQTAEIAAKYGKNAAHVATQWGDAVDEKLKGAISEIVSKGLHVKDGVKVLGDALAAAGVSAQKPFLLETLVRTNVNLSYMAGRMSFNENPIIQELLWGYEYETVEDDRVRPEHALLQGTKLPKDDPFWKFNMPPNGYNCRCTVLEVWSDEAPTNGGTPPPGKFTDESGVEHIPGADKGWEFNPGEIFKDNTTSLPVAVKAEAQLAEQEMLAPGSGRTLEDLEQERAQLRKQRDQLPKGSDEWNKMQAKIRSVDSTISRLKKFEGVKPPPPVKPPPVVEPIKPPPVVEPKPPVGFKTRVDELKAERELLKIERDKLPRASDEWNKINAKIRSIDSSISRYNKLGGGTPIGTTKPPIAPPPVKPIKVGPVESKVIDPNLPMKDRIQAYDQQNFGRRDRLQKELDAFGKSPMEQDKDLRTRQFAIQDEIGMLNQNERVTGIPTSEATKEQIRKLLKERNAIWAQRQDLKGQAEDFRKQQRRIIFKELNAAKGDAIEFKIDASKVRPATRQKTQDARDWWEQKLRVESSIPEKGTFWNKQMHGRVDFKMKEGHSEHYSPAGRHVECGKNTEEKVYIHEFAHAVEYQVPGVKKAVTEFVKHRFGNEQFVAIGKAIGHPKSYCRHGRVEMGRKDKMDLLFDELSSQLYCGKPYDDGATEMLSMGMQVLYDDPARVLARDPETFNFLAGILDGSLRL